MRASVFAFAAFCAFVTLGACDDEIIPPKTPTKTVQKEATPEERRDAACKAKELPGAPSRATEAPTELPSGNVAKIEVDAPDEAKVRSAIGFTAGDSLSLPKTQDAMRRIWALGDVDDVRLEARPSPQGVVLHFTVAKRPTYGQVVIHGGSIIDAPELEKALHATTSAPYDPVTLVAARGTLVEGLKQRGYSDATLMLTGTRAQDGTVDLCVNLHEGAKITIDTVSFKGLSKLKEEDLRATLDTDHGRINAPGGVVDQAKIDEALGKMAEIFDAHGLAKGNVSTKTQRTGDKVSIVFEVDEGPVITLRRYDVKGDMLGDASAYRKLLSLKSKDPFSRQKLVADMQKIGEMHDKKGRKDLEVQPQTQLDDKNNTIDVVLVVVDPKKAKQQPPPPPPPGKK